MEPPSKSKFLSPPMTMDRAVRVGVFRYTGGIGPFRSVEGVWTQTISALRRWFEVEIHSSPDLDLRQCRTAAELLDHVDIAFVLLPYQALPPNRSVPALVLALGSLHKGGPWIARFADRLTRADTVVINSRSCRAMLEEMVVGPTLGVDLVPLAIDARVFHPREPDPAVRARLGIPASADVVVYAGRLSLQKNVNQLFEVVRRLRRRDRDAYLLLAGAPDDNVIPEFENASLGEHGRWLADRARGLGIDRYVRWLGHLNKGALAVVFSIADVGISLSTLPNENFGLAVVEMQATGLPVVTTDWGGYRDTVGGDGLNRIPTMLSRLGPRFSVEAATETLISIMEDESFRHDLGAAALTSAARFTEERYDRSLARAVREALRRSETVNPEPLGLDPSWCAAMLETVGRRLDLRWVALDMVEQAANYRRILRHAATFVHDEVDWFDGIPTERAFDWTTDGRGNVRSSDRRWSPGLPPYRLDGPRPAALLAADGLIVPTWTMHRARQALGSQRRRVR